MSSGKTMHGERRMEKAVERLKGQKPLFVFDLDSTITRCELLPLLARNLGREAEMTELTEQAMAGETPFGESFLRRVALLREFPLHHAREIAASMPVHDEIARFLQENASRCLIMTGNLDAWIVDLVRRLGMDGRCLCSTAETEGDRLLGVAAVLDKTEAAARLKRPFVAVGDGSNDAGMLKLADLGIGFAGVREPGAEVRRAADWIAEDEHVLCALLRTLL